MGGEPRGVDGGRGDDHLEVRAPGQQLLEVAQQEVDIETALVGLVDDDGVVAAQESIVGDLGEQYPIGHHGECGGTAGAFGEADLVADQVADLDGHLIGDPLGDAAGGDPAGLGMCDMTASQGQADLGQLGGLARTRLPGDHHDLVVGDELGDLVGMGGDRQVGVEADDATLGQDALQG